MQPLVVAGATLLDGSTMPWFSSMPPARASFLHSHTMHVLFQAVAAATAASGSGHLWLGMTRDFATLLGALLRHNGAGAGPLSPPSPSDPC